MPSQRKPSPLLSSSVWGLPGGNGGGGGGGGGGMLPRAREIYPWPPELVGVAYLPIQHDAPDCGLPVHSYTWQDGPAAQHAAIHLSTEEISGMAFKPFTFRPLRSCGNDASEHGGAGARCSDALRSGSLKC